MDSKKIKESFHVELVYSAGYAVGVQYWRSGKGLIRAVLLCASFVIVEGSVISYQYKFISSRLS